MIAFARLISALAASGLMAACVVVPISTTTFYPEDSQPTRGWPETASCPTPARAAQDRAAVVGLINAARGEARLAPVSLSPGISDVAQHYACENVARQSIEHVGSDGSTLLERFRRGGLKPALAAENTGIGYASVASAFAGWMASPPHRANILRADVTQIGLGEASGARPVWVLDFLAPR